MVKINLYITVPQMARLDELKQETGMAYAEIVRRALDAYLTAAQLAVSPRLTSAKRKGRKAK